MWLAGGVLDDGQHFVLLVFFACNPSSHTFVAV